MRVFALIAALFIGFSQLVQAQSDKALFKKYQYGKSFLNNNQYAQAYEVFKSLSAVEIENRYRNHALYFYALTAYQTARQNEARNALFELLKKAPDWENKDDAYFLLGTIDLEKRNFASALEQFDNIKKSEEFELQINKQLEKGMQNMRVDDLEFLYRKFDFDIIGEKLFSALQKVSIYPKYEALYEEILPKYGTQLQSPDSTVSEESIVYKEAYNVAIMLPFMYGKFDADSLPSNQQRVFDLYQGIVMAAQDLDEKGIKLNLFAFDTQNDSLTTVEILSDTSFAKMDLIVGPLYRNTIPVVADYARLFRKVMVNPVSSNESIITNNPFAFLTTATSKSKAEAVADYAFDSLKSKQTYIIYGLKKSEEDEAFHYGEYFQDKGGEVAMFRRFEFDKKFFQKLQDSLSTLAEDSLPHVFVSASDPAVASNVISALQNLQASSKIFAPISWLDFDQFTYAQLEKMRVHFIQPRYLDTNGYYYRSFRSNYVKKMNLVPSLYACLGYETMNFFGKQLKDYGSGLFSKIHEIGKVNGRIFSAFDYSKGNDNGFVSLLKFENGALVEANSLSEFELSKQKFTKEKED